jgi:phosphoribosylformylglycinamidine cyclo-ligase
MRPEVLAGIGGFGGLVEIGKRFKDPVLVSGTDGVGTKLMLAFALDRHDTVGIDLVAMSVNDILVQGAEPLFFLDYYACGKLDVDVATASSRASRRVRDSGCALIGGETAEMPACTRKANTTSRASRWVVDARTSSTALHHAGDVVLGIASSGPHSNGFSLIRKIVRQADRISPRRSTEPRSAPPARADAHLRQAGARADARRAGEGHGAHHGRRTVENVPRMLPPACRRAVAVAWSRPPIFSWLQRHGNVADEEMHRVFNCGIGMTIVVAPEHADRAIKVLAALASARIASAASSRSPRASAPPSSCEVATPMAR